ncbi:MAG: hypothetical protein AAF065_08895 [Verrucomicrobiota bacterium]
MPVIASYTKLEDAHLAVSKLAGSGVDAWLRDEATANIYWLYSNAIGGVKVEVFEEDVERASEILELPKEASGLLTCPHCGSENVRLREMNFGALLLLVFANLISPIKSRHADCSDCGKSFELPLQ